MGSLYHLDCEASSEMANVADKTEKEHILHRQFGLEVCRNLLKDQLVDGFDYSCKRKPVSVSRV